MSNLTVQHIKSALTFSSRLPFRELKNRGFRLVCNDKNEPVRFFGSSSVVFKITDGSGFYALKCYTTDLFNRWEYLQKVEQKLQEYQKEWIVPFEIYMNELEAEDDEHIKQSCNIVLMPWIEGERLSDLVQIYCAQEKFYPKLKELTCSFIKLVNQQYGQPFSHGDVSPKNIMVLPEGKMILIDHDSFTFEGWKLSAGQGGWNFACQHPYRNPRTPDLFADHFSFLLLATTLKAIELNPGLYDQFTSSRGLLFNVDDYKYPEDSLLFNQLKKITDPYFRGILQLLLTSLKKNTTEVPELLYYLNAGSETSSAFIEKLPADIKKDEPQVNQEKVTEKFSSLPGQQVPIISSMVVNEKGIIVEQPIQAEKQESPVIQQSAIHESQVFDEQLIQQNEITDEQQEDKKSGEEILQTGTNKIAVTVQPSTTVTEKTISGIHRKKGKIWIGVIPALSVVVLTILGLNMFFTDVKVADPVKTQIGISADYQGEITKEKTSINYAITNDTLPKEMSANKFFNDSLQNENFNKITTRETISSVNTEIKNELNTLATVNPLPDMPQVPEDAGKKLRTEKKQSLDLKKKSKRKSNDNISVSFRKIEF